MRLRLIGATATCALAMTAPAFAHEGHAAVSSFDAGLMHPFGGLDHLAAMVAVGWAATIGPNMTATRLIGLPATFVAALLVGAGLGFAGVGVGFAEFGILASLAALAAVLAFGARLPLAATFALVALAGVPHGIAHAAELPASATASAFITGFTLGTAILHAIGVVIGVAIAKAAARAEPFARTAAATGLAAVVAFSAAGLG